jgi:hypothetical protein
VVMAALYRARQRRRLVMGCMALAVGGASLGFGAPAIAAALESAPTALSTGGIGLVLLVAIALWSFASGPPRQAA